MNAREREEDAEKLANEYVRDKTPHIDDPKEDVPFKLGHPSWGSVRRPVTFMAKPFLNRLYHKLEATPGHPHHSESGLTGHGKYGFDMTKPQDAKTIKTIDEDGDEVKVKTPNLTAGLKFPSAKQISSRLIDFYNLNSQRMFGDLPKDVEWKKVPGISDTWSAGYVKRQIFNRVVARLRSSRKKYKNETELQQEAKQLANEEFIQLADAGQLKGPPIPGVAPQGLSIKIDDQGDVINPPLYLPYQTKMVKIRDEKTGAVREEPKLVPIVKPAHFFRELGTDSTDFEYETDEGGQPTKKKKFNPDGTPVFTVPQNQLRGHEKKYVYVSDDEYKHKKSNDHQAAAAIHFNAATEQCLHMTKGNPDWQNTWDAVFGDMQKVDLDNYDKVIPNENGSFYDDIIKGIKKCLDAGRCGGATAHELGILRHSIDDFHQIVIVKMLNCMGNPELKTSEGRIAFAFNKVSSIMQKDHKGGGSRRKRNFMMGDRDTSFSAGGEKNIEDELMSRATDKIRVRKKRGRGERQFAAQGTETTPYNLKNMREAITKMLRDAHEADATSVEAKKLSKQHAGVEIVRMLRDGINKQVDFKVHLTDTLANLYQQSGQSKDEAEKAAKEQVKSWMDDESRTTANSLMSAFQNHPLVQDAIMASGEEVRPAKHSVPLSDEDLEHQKDASAWLHRKLEKIQGNPTLLQQELAKDESGLSKVINQMVATYFGGVVDDKILDSLQAELDQKYKVAKTEPPKAAAAKEIAPKPATPAAAGPPIAQPKPAATGGATPPTIPDSTGMASDLGEKRDWLGLAHHPGYLAGKSSGNIAHKKKVLAFFHANKDKYQPHEYESAVKNLTKTTGE